MRDMLLGRLVDTLPSGWLWKQFGELVAHSQNGISKRRSAIGNPTAVLRLADIREGMINESAPRDIKLSDEEVNKYVLRDGDLLCIRVNGSRSLTGRLVCFRTPKVWTYCDHFIRFRLKPEISDSKYIAYYFQTQAVRAHLSKHMVSTAGQNTVSQGTMLGIAVPVPSMHQQQIIVAEIEKQFSRLDEAVANLKRYKAAVLKAAVEGKLTEDWRKQHPNVEPVSKLLERILAERRMKWSGRGKYKVPTVLEPTVLPLLPDGWAWTSLDHLLREPLRNGHSAKASGCGYGLRAFTLSAVTQGDFSERNTKLTVAHKDKVADLWAQSGDIYVERSNTPELVGLARLYKGPARFAFIPDLLIRVRVHADVLAQFVEVCLLSEHIRRYFRSKAQGISGTMPKIDQSVIEKTPIPLPPVYEQGRIVAEVERSLSIIEELEAVVRANLTRAERMRQSILSNVFAGKLVCANTNQRGERSADIQMAKSLE